MSAPVINRPEPGYYRYRAVRNGPLLPARIWLDDSIPERPAIMLAELNGRQTLAAEAWPRVLGHPISRSEYEYMMAMKAHAEAHEPSMPEANPTQPIDLSKQAAIGPRS